MYLDILFLKLYTVIIHFIILNLFIRTARENVSVNEESTTHVCDVSSGNNTAKHM